MRLSLDLSAKPPQFRVVFEQICRNAISPQALALNGQEQAARPRMKNDTGLFGIILSGIVALAALVFIVSGGALGGKTTVDGDKDLPPIADSSK